MATSYADTRKTVLVVENDALVALDLSDTVEDIGFAVDGPYRKRNVAAQAVEHAMPDFAVLDVMTDDGEVFPLADRLTEAGVPIIFHSGRVLPEDVQRRYPEAQAVAKPCPPDRIIAMLQEAMQQAT